MPDSADPSAVFEAHRPWIQKVAGITCRRNSVWGDDAEDFLSLALMKVVENDFAVIRQFQGRADLKTYLATVVVRRFYEWTRERWGRWRHSARAQQLGDLAMDLEALVHRDGYALREACEVLRSRGRTESSDAELARLFAELPDRTPHPGKAPTTSPDELADDDRPDERVIGGEVESRCRRVLDVLYRALALLQPEDQVLVRGRYGDGKSVADLARALRTEQAPLYRRSEKLKGELRKVMEREGVGRDDVRECLGLDE
jgi:RNA polymerase sigma factor for flagellar operon FliA